MMKALLRKVSLSALEVASFQAEAALRVVPRRLTLAADVIPHHHPDRTTD